MASGGLAALRNDGPWTVPETACLSALASLRDGYSIMDIVLQL